MKSRKKMLRKLLCYGLLMLYGTVQLFTHVLQQTNNIKTDMMLYL